MRSGQVGQGRVDLEGGIDHGIRTFSTTSCTSRSPRSRRRALQGRARARPRRSRPAWAWSAASPCSICARTTTSGLADHPAVRQAAHEALDHWGYGMASVRFICGTQQPHKQLEAALSQFLGTEDTILYSSCWDANGGLFETMLGAEDAVISDELNHASIIDGIRLCKAQRLRYRNNDMADLEAKLQEARAAALPADRHRRRVLDGRDHRQPGGDLRAGRPLRRPGDGRRFARRGVSRSAGPRHARVSRRDGPHRHPHRHAGQGPGRRQRRLHQRPRQKSSRSCASGRGPTCSPTRCRRRSWRPR